MVYKSILIDNDLRRFLHTKEYYQFIYCYCIEKFSASCNENTSSYWLGTSFVNSDLQRLVNLVIPISRGHCQRQLTRGLYQKALLALYKLDYIQTIRYTTWHYYIVHVYLSLQSTNLLSYSIKRRDDIVCSGWRVFCTRGKVWNRAGHMRDFSVDDFLNRSEFLIQQFVWNLHERRNVDTVG